MAQEWDGSSAVARRLTRHLLQEMSRPLPAVPGETIEPTRSCEEAPESQGRPDTGLG